MCLWKISLCTMYTLNLTIHTYVICTQKGGTITLSYLVDRRLDFGNVSNEMYTTQQPALFLTQPLTQHHFVKVIHVIYYTDINWQSYTTMLLTKLASTVAVAFLWSSCKVPDEHNEGIKCIQFKTRYKAARKVNVDAHTYIKNTSFLPPSFSPEKWNIQRSQGKVEFWWVLCSKWNVKWIKLLPVIF